MLFFVLLLSSLKIKNKKNVVIPLRSCLTEIWQEQKLAWGDMPSVVSVEIHSNLQWSQVGKTARSAFNWILMPCLACIKFMQMTPPSAYCWHIAGMGGKQRKNEWLATPGAVEVEGGKEGCSVRLTNNQHRHRSTANKPHRHTRWSLEHILGSQRVSFFPSLVWITNHWRCWEICLALGASGVIFSARDAVVKGGGRYMHSS